MEYDSSSLTKLTGLQPVQMRPGMYTDTDSPIHLVLEIMDNALDESVASDQKVIDINVEDGVICVRDYGRGIPFDTDVSEVSGVRLAMEELHAGAKFYTSEQSPYKTTGGLHGVGCAVVNALSKDLQVNSYRDGKVYTVRYTNGELVSETVDTADRDERGTKVCFRPDPQYFNDGICWDDLVSSLEQKSAVSGIVIKYTKDKEETLIRYDLSSYFTKALSGIVSQNKYMAIPFSGTGGSKKDKILIEGIVALGWVNMPGGHSFYNNIYTFGGGDHLNGATIGAKEAVLDHLDGCVRRDLVLAGDIPVCVLVSAKVPGVYGARLAGQQKGTLDCKDVYNLAMSLVRPVITLALSENHTLRENMIKHINSRISRRESEKEERNKRKTVALPKDMVSPRNWGPNTEIFLVEGQSAAKRKAVQIDFQGIIPMRGMVVNAVTSGPEGDPVLDWVLDNVHRFGKIMFLTDADPAGSGIVVYGCAYLFLAKPELFIDGRVYAVRPPLYRIKRGPDVQYTDSLDNVTDGDYVTRFKGIGEMNVDEVQKTCTNPNARKTVRLTVDDAQVARNMFELLMGRNVAARKAWMGGEV